MTDKACPNCRQIFYAVVIQPVWCCHVRGKIIRLFLTLQCHRPQKKLTMLQKNAAYAPPQKT